MSIGSFAQTLALVVEDSITVNRSIAAAVAWVLWEMAITFDQEVKYIWMRKFSLYQVFYLLLRYGTPASLLLMLAVNTNFSVKFNVEFCEGYLIWMGLGLVYPVFWGEALVVLRMYALYGQSLKILAFCLVMFFGRIALSVCSVVSHTLAADVVAANLPMSGCTAIPTNEDIMPTVSVIFSSFTSCVFFSLTLYKFLCAVPKSMWRRARAMREAAPLLQLVLRDGSAYLAALLAAEVMLLTITIKYSDRPLAILGFPWAMATYCIAGSRLVLNLRAEAMSGETNARPPPQVELRARARDRAPTDIVFLEPSEYGSQGLSSAARNLSAHQSVTGHAGLGKEALRSVV